MSMFFERFIVWNVRYGICDVMIIIRLTNFIPSLYKIIRAWCDRKKVNLPARLPAAYREGIDGRDAVTINLSPTTA